MHTFTHSHDIHITPLLFALFISIFLPIVHLYIFCSLERPPLLSSTKTHKNIAITNTNTHTVCPEGGRHFVDLCVCAGHWESPYPISPCTLCLSSRCRRSEQEHAAMHLAKKPAPFYTHRNSTDPLLKPLRPARRTHSVEGTGWENKDTFFWFVFLIITILFDLLNRENGWSWSVPE